MEFEIQPDYTVEDYAAFWHGFLEKRPGQKGARRVSDRGMWIGGWFFLLAGVFVLAVCWRNPLGFSPVPVFMIVWGLAFLALGIVTLIQRRPGRPEPVQPRWAKRSWKRWAALSTELRWRYCFTLEGVELHNSGSDHRYDYDRLQQIWQDQGHVYFTLDGHWHILNKSQFTRGDPAQFAAFLTERTGQPVKWVNGVEERSGVSG